MELEKTVEVKSLHIEDIAFKNVDDFPAYHDIKNGDLFNLSLSLNTVDLTHGLHRFAGKYIPQIPRWAISQFSLEGELILDPFMGSGTTLVEALTFNRITVGYDIDPLAQLISEAKIATPSLNNIKRIGEQIRKLWSWDSVALKVPMEGVVNFGHWFTNDAWAKLQSLFELINSIECEQKERKYLLIVFSSILRLVSNADDQSQKTYVSGTNPKTPPDVVTAFWKFFEKSLLRLEKLESSRNPLSKSIVDKSSNATSMNLREESVSLIVTSPPYLDSIDYVYNSMAEYFWLGKTININSRIEFNGLRKQLIGSKSPKSILAIPKSVKHLIKEDDFTKERLRSVAAYLNEMVSHFTEASKVLKDNGYYVMVLGNSQTQKGIIPLHDCMVSIARDSGLVLRKSFGYRIRRHYMKFPRKGNGGIILIDWILVFQKSNDFVFESDRLPLPWTRLFNDQVAH